MADAPTEFDWIALMAAAPTEFDWKNKIIRGKRVSIPVSHQDDDNDMVLAHGLRDTLEYHLKIKSIFSRRVVFRKLSIQSLRSVVSRFNRTHKPEEVALKTTDKIKDQGVRFDESYDRLKIRNARWVSVADYDKHELYARVKDSIRRFGPVCAVFGITEDFKKQTWRTRTYRGPQLPVGDPSVIHHAVTITGYEGHHWVYQNSWGRSFGRNGMGRVHRNVIIKYCLISLPD